MEKHVPAHVDHTETVHRDLHDGMPLWASKDTRRVSFTPCQRNFRCDCVVVGAGISGALTAEALTRRGLGVSLLDRREPGVGSTIASTALLQFEIDTPLTILREKIGAAAADQAWRRSLRTVADLGACIRDLRLDVPFTHATRFTCPVTFLIARGSPEKRQRGDQLGCHHD
jgi:hypothetical protein